MVDQDGLPVRLHITAGQTSDKTIARLLLDALLPGTVIIDRGYDSLALVERVAARGDVAHIPTQSRVRLQRSVPPDLYHRRNLIERYFCKLNQFSISVHSRHRAAGRGRHRTFSWQCWRQL